MAKQKCRLDSRIDGSLTGGHSESLPSLQHAQRQIHFLCLKYFLKKYEQFRVFGLRLAYILIHNELLVNRSDIDKLEGLINQKMETAPAHENKWRGSNLDCSEKYRYQQYICHSNKCKKLRTYCIIYQNLFSMS